MSVLVIAALAIVLLSVAVSGTVGGWFLWLTHKENRRERQEEAMFAAYEEHFRQGDSL